MSGSVFGVSHFGAAADSFLFVDFIVIDAGLQSSTMYCKWVEVSSPENKRLNVTYNYSKYSIVNISFV